MDAWAGLISSERRSNVTDRHSICDESPAIGRFASTTCCAVRMWLGLLYSPTDDGAQVVFSAWAADGNRPFTIAGNTEDAPAIARALRNAAACAGAWSAPPRCGECLAPLDLPPL